MDIGQGLAAFGQSMAGAMNDYHKQHVQYDQQMQLAEALSRIGINAQGQITQIDPEAKDKSIIPVLDKKALTQFQTATHEGRVKSAGALEALTRIGVHTLSQVAGPLGQERLKEAQLGNQRFDTEVVPGTTLPLTAGQSAQVLTEQQGRKSAPAGKQFWEGDDESPPGYYTPNQIANLRNRKTTQQSKGAYQDLKTKISLTKDKTAALTKQMAGFSKAYGIPETLFGSTTKIYNEGSSVRDKIVPKGYYRVEVPTATGDITFRDIGKEEWNQGKGIYEQLQKQRSSIDQLGGKIQIETSKAKAMFDWATRNPGAQGAAQVKAKAQAILNELSSAINQPAPSPTPDPDEE